MLEYLEYTWPIWLITIAFLVIGIQFSFLTGWFVKTSIINIVLLVGIGYVFLQAGENADLARAKDVIILILTWNTDIPIGGVVLPIGGFLLFKTIITFILPI